MTAESLLITYVQIGVAISGFSGIVVSLGNRGRGEWSYRERQLLYVLLRMSGGCTLLSAYPWSWPPPGSPSRPCGPPAAAARWSCNSG